MKLKAVSGVMLTLLLTFTLSTSTGMCQSNLVERWVPYVPSSADLKFWMSNGISYINVSMTFPDGGFNVSDWGTVVRDRGQIWADSKIWDWTGCSVLWIITLSHTYDLGRLEEGNYTFTFKAWNETVKSIDFIITGYEPVHNLDTGLNYTTIQEAIDAPETSDGHTIFVEEGIYCENLVVNKSLSLIGKDRDSTIIYGNNSAYLVNVEASNAKITGFTLQGFSFANIYISGATGVTIKGNRILFTGAGIDLHNSNNSVITSNIIEGCGLDNIGIIVVESSRCIIENNTISGAVYDGIRLIWSADNNIITSNTISNNDYGIHVIHSNINTIINNTIVNNSNGIFMERGNGNTVVGNTLSDNWAAISFSFSSYDNVIYHNNFFNNTHQIGNPLHSDPLSSNRWDNGLEGNYWSDYEGQDANSDGIGDTPYIVDGDNYPLMGMFSDFNATSEYHVQTICNSTISDFQFNGTAISFNVTGETDTIGFCRICIPTALMNVTYKVYVNGTEVSYDLLPCSNSTHSYLYFTYNLSTQEVIMIPEFPSWTPILLLLIMLTVALTIYKRKLLKTLIH